MSVIPDFSYLDFSYLEMRVNWTYKKYYISCSCSM